MISIIVPVFNSRRTLQACIDSILRQTYKDLEVILVNDGSKDDSLSICELNQRLDKRVKIIDKPNEGPGKARNDGLKLATGDYIGFVDSDDIIDENMYMSMINLAEEHNADIVQCGHEKVAESGEILFTSRYNNFIVKDKQKCFEEYCKQKNIDNYSPTKIYRKCVVQDVEFGHLHYSEDAVFIMQAFLNCRTLAVVNAPFYKYIQTEGSACRSAFNYKFLDTVKAGEVMYDRCNAVYPQFSHYFALYIIKWARYCYCELYQKDPDTAEYLWQLYLKYYEKMSGNCTMSLLALSLAFFRYLRPIYLLLK